MSTDLRSILLDIENESKGFLLQEEFEIRGKKYLFKLLNDKENNWSISHMRADNEFTLAMSARVSQLAISIRAIDGYSIEDIFASEMKQVSVNDEDPDKEVKEKKNETLRHLFFKYEDDKQLIAAHLFKDFLLKQSSIIVNEMHECWQKLVMRQGTAQTELKNLSGESSGLEEKKN